jgi:hypothetical protein
LLQNDTWSKSPLAETRVNNLLQTGGFADDLKNRRRQLAANALPAIGMGKEFSVILDFETWLAAEPEREGTPFTIRSLCQCILQTLQRDKIEQ